MYEPRTYRHWVKGTDLVSFSISIKETDLYIRASTNLQGIAYELTSQYRHILETYIEKHPGFESSLKPLFVAEDAPHIVKEMAESAAKVGVGPMASVAGAIAEFVGSQLSAFSPEVIIENGGDIYLKSLKGRIVGIYAGKSPLSGKLGLEINGEDTPLGICTSSGTVGHSFSFGNADAVVVLSKSATLADAAATATGNLIAQESDIPCGIDFAKSIEELYGGIIIINDRIGLWGKIKICRLSM